MVVVGRADDDGVHLALHFAEHLAVIRKRFRAGVGVFFGVAEPVVAGIHVAICHEPLAKPLESLHIVAAHQPRADEAEAHGRFVEFGIFRGVLRVQISGDVRKRGGRSPEYPHLPYKTSSVFHDSLFMYNLFGGHFLRNPREQK